MDNIQKRDFDATIVNTPAKEKSVSFTTADKAFAEERSFQDQEEKKPIDSLKIDQRSKMVTSHVAIIIHPVKLTGPGSVTTGRKGFPLQKLRINWPERLKINPPWAASIVFPTQSCVEIA